MNDSNTNLNPYISISDLAATVICPRRCYYRLGNKQKIPVQYHICRQIASGIPLKQNPDQIWEDIRLIAPEIDDEMKTYFSDCYMSSKNAELIYPDMQDIIVKSERLMISGQIDKCDKNKKFSIVRCRNAPDVGCYADDRLRITGYLLAYNEQNNTHLTGGNIEYIRSGTVRHYQPGPRDRRLLIHLIRLYKKIRNGYFPEKLSNAPCKNCLFKDKCETPYRTLSSLFFKKSE